MRGALSEIGEALLDLVFPPRCAACGEAPARASPFCSTCDGAIEPAPDLGDGVGAASLFGGPIADAVHALKYGGRAEVAGPLGRWMAGRVAVPEGMAVVWVPLGRRRRIERTYDQAMLLAVAVARASRQPLLRGALRRVRETPPQVGRDRAARARNVAGAFAASRAVAGRDICLVDDVVTTGATVEAATRALRDAGARRVVVAALSRAE
ncbi:MAG: ComF family protein [Deltaproteobacteria bacterium]